MKQITDPEISKLVDRLCTLPAQAMTMLVESTQIRRELGSAIKRYAKSTDHAHRAVNVLMELRWRPTPVEVRSTFEQTPIEPPPAVKPADSSCEQCYGTGWKTIFRGGLSGAARCECTRVGVPA